MLSYRQLLFDQLTPISIYHKLKEKFKDELSFLFESAINSEKGNFTFIFIGANERISYKNSITTFTKSDGVSKNLEENPFKFLKSYYKNIDSAKYAEFSQELGIGYIDGFVGYIGYDAVKIFEPTLKKHMDNLKDELNTPDLDLIRPKLVIAFSHKTNKLTLIAHHKNFENELDNLISYLHEPCQYIEIKKSIIDEKLGNFTCTKEKFFKIIDDSKEMIRSGDIFQILISNRFTQQANIDTLSFYRILRSKNPSPYMFLLDFKEFAIVGSSPEVMVGLNDNQILIRPIAGTRRRGNTAKRDEELAKEMLHDEKECAEHLMLVDLGRNDVGRVSKCGSVKVTEMMRVERYSHVMHMVSDITATLDEKHDMFDLFGATFTAGTMTGAPKIRAMELIADYEGVKRGFYSGAIGYFGFDGNMDSAIAIRTAWKNSEKIIFQAGAGIVADSQKELEFLEVTNKLGAMMSTLNELKLEK